MSRTLENGVTDTGNWYVMLGVCWFVTKGCINAFSSFVIFLPLLVLPRSEEAEGIFVKSVIRTLNYTPTRMCQVKIKDYVMFTDTFLFRLKSKNSNGSSK